MDRRMIIARTLGRWGRGSTVEKALKMLKRAGGDVRKWRVLLISAPRDAWVDSYGDIQCKGRMFCIGRNGLPLPRNWVGRPLV